MHRNYKWHGGYFAFACYSFTNLWFSFWLVASLPSGRLQAIKCNWVASMLPFSTLQILQLEPGAMLYPATFVAPTSAEVLQFELGRIKVMLFLRLRARKSSGRLAWSYLSYEQNVKGCKISFLFKFRHSWLSKVEPFRNYLAFIKKWFIKRWLKGGPYAMYQCNAKVGCGGKRLSTSNICLWSRHFCWT